MTETETKILEILKADESFAVREDINHYGTSARTVAQRSGLRQAEVARVLRRLTRTGRVHSVTLESESKGRKGGRMRRRISNYSIPPQG